MEKGDPLINAYEKATGKKYLLKNPVDAADEKPAEKQPPKGDEKGKCPKGRVGTGCGESKKMEEFGK